MKNQKQDTSSKLLLKRSINLFIVTGMICTKCEFRTSKYPKRLFARARMKIRSSTGSFAYVDVFGFGDIAQEMNLVCNLGNTVYVEAHLTNKRYVDKKGKAKAKMYFMVDKIDRLTVSLKNQELEDTLEILDTLDPANYIVDEFDETLKGK